MSCDPERVTAFVDGELDASSPAAVAAHVEACPACRAQAEAERDLRARLGRLPVPELPAGFEARLRSRVRRRPVAAMAARWALPLAATLVLGFWLRGHAPFVAWDLARDHDKCFSRRPLPAKVWSGDPAVVSGWFEAKGTRLPRPSRPGGRARAPGRPLLPAPSTSPPPPTSTTPRKTATSPSSWCPRTCASAFASREKRGATRCGCCASRESSSASSASGTPTCRPSSPPCAPSWPVSGEEHVDRDRRRPERIAADPLTDPECRSGRHPAAHVGEGLDGPLVTTRLLPERSREAGDAAGRRGSCRASVPGRPGASRGSPPNGLCAEEVDLEAQDRGRLAHELDTACHAGSTGQPAVAGEELRVESLGEGHVDGVVGREVLTKGPDTPQKRLVRVPLRVERREVDERRRAPDAASISPSLT